MWGGGGGGGGGGAHRPQLTDLRSCDRHHSPALRYPAGMNESFQSHYLIMSHVHMSESRRPSQAQGVLGPMGARRATVQFKEVQESLTCWEGVSSSQFQSDNPSMSYDLSWNWNGSWNTATSAERGTSVFKAEADFFQTVPIMAKASYEGM